MGARAEFGLQQRIELASARVQPVLREPEAHPRQAGAGGGQHEGLDAPAPSEPEPAPVAAAQTTSQPVTRVVWARVDRTGDRLISRARRHRLVVRVLVSATGGNHVARRATVWTVVKRRAKRRKKK
jgi:hypothetical protein